MGRSEEWAERRRDEFSGFLFGELNLRIWQPGENPSKARSKHV
jgi:hypothetical protein